MSNQIGTCELCGDTTPCPTCSGGKICPVYLSEADIGMVSEILCQRAQELVESSNFTKNQFARELSDQMHVLCRKFNKARKEIQEKENEQSRVPQRSLG